MDGYGLAVVITGASALVFAAGYFTRAHLDDRHTTRLDPRDAEAQAQWADLQRIFNQTGDNQ